MNFSVVNKNKPIKEKTRGTLINNCMILSQSWFCSFRLQQFPMLENRSGPQTIEFLNKRVLALGAVQSGQFLVDCETFMSVPALGE